VLAEALGVSLPTLKRWRAAGQLESARHVLEWAALVHPRNAAAALDLARRLAGLAPRRRRP
jgi:predicted site-specific integrase-resolvase